MEDQIFACDNKQSSDCNDVMFNDAEYGVLDFGGNGQAAYFSPERRLNLLGFTYRDVRTPLGYMLILLQRSYNREPYAFLEKLYRDRGDRTTADSIYYERRRVGCNKIPAHDVFRLCLDGLFRYVFGYGVRMSFPAMWVAALMGLTALLLARRDALELVDWEAATIPRADERPFLQRLATSLLVSANALIPKAKLPGVDQWHPRTHRIQLLGRQLPLTYKNVASAATLTAWFIITVSVSLFSISDFVKN